MIYARLQSILLTGFMQYFLECASFLISFLILSFPSPHIQAHFTHSVVSRKMMFILPMFPYPSGNLHMGHTRVYCLTDVLARYFRLKGHSVLHPIGWDSFGLPAERAAFSSQIHPQVWTAQNISSMKSQLKSLNISFDWDMELKTSSPEYYKWTQWLFLKLWRAGLAFRACREVNWDPEDETVLADEQVDSQGRSWRSGALVQKRQLLQWFFRITAFREELAETLDSQEAQLWPDTVVNGQKLWLGKMKDWLVSRQRYWGTPIPIIHCQKCGIVEVPLGELPVLLPEHWKLPLWKHPTWKHRNCPKCCFPAERETDTLDTFVDSSFYFARFLDSHNSEALCDASRLRQVDFYAGGVEHATSHLLYARFIWLYLRREFGRFDLPSFPFKQLITQGMVLGKTFQCTKTGIYLSEVEAAKVPKSSLRISWEKMSKSKGNGISPMSITEKYGVDASRLCILFKSPPEMPIQWNDVDIIGHVRWIGRLNRWMSGEKSQNSNQVLDLQDLKRRFDKLVVEYERNLTSHKHSFNVCIALMMTFSRQFASYCPHENPGLKEVLLDFCVLLFPFATQTACDLYGMLGGVKDELVNRPFPNVHVKYRAKSSQSE